MKNEVVTFDAVEDKIILIRNQRVILDSDVATRYGVETKRVNEVVKLSSQVLSLERALYACCYLATSISSILKPPSN